MRSSFGYIISWVRVYRKKWSSERHTYWPLYTITILVDLDLIGGSLIFICDFSVWVLYLPFSDPYQLRSILTTTGLSLSMFCQQIEILINVSSKHSVFWKNVTKYCSFSGFAMTSSSFSRHEKQARNPSLKVDNRSKRPIPAPRKQKVEGKFFSIFLSIFTQY